MFDVQVKHEFADAFQKAADENGGVFVVPVKGVRAEVGERTRFYSKKNSNLLGIGSVINLRPGAVVVEVAQIYV
jgi:hypothetical protein